MANVLSISGRHIGINFPPFIIAEMSGNHNQSLDRAFSIIKSAAESGAHALKIQTYTPDSMTLDIKKDEFFLNDKSSPWTGKSLYDLYEEACTPYDWHEKIFSYAKSLGLIAFSTPFDDVGVDFLEELDVPCYKIASFENTDLNLIKKVASTKKPVIISTGMASLSELDEAVHAARLAGCKDLILLKCTSSYPSTSEDSNILTIPHLRKMFDCEVGLSDHTMGIGVAVASTALESTVIEKHFTLKRSDGGVDSAFSIEPFEFLQLTIETERAWRALGKVQYGPTEGEMKSLQFRRTLYVTKDLRCGDILTKENIRAIRPGLGMPVKFFDIILGRAIKKDVERGTPMTWELIE